MVLCIIQIPYCFSALRSLKPVFFLSASLICTGLEKIGAEKEGLEKEWQCSKMGRQENV